MTIFLVLVLAHLIADFVTQTSHMNQTKREFSSSIFSKGLLYHSLHHLVISFLLIVIFLEWQHTYLIVILLVTISHYLIDVAKLKWETLIVTKQSGKRSWYEPLLEKNTPAFIVDQLLHLISLNLVLYFFNNHVTLSEFTKLFSFASYESGSMIRSLVLIILFVMVTYPTAYFISMLMKDFDDKPRLPEIATTLDQENEQIEKIKDSISGLETDMMITESYQEKASSYALKVQYHKYSNANENPRGRYIGILERILIVILVIQNLYQGLALIIAMKTLTRFKQFDDKNFAEYYLIGTLLSLIMGVLLALTIKEIW